MRPYFGLWPSIPLFPHCQINWNNQADHVVGNLRVPKIKAEQEVWLRACCGGDQLHGLKCDYYVNVHWSGTDRGVGMKPCCWCQALQMSCLHPTEGEIKYFMDVHSIHNVKLGPDMHTGIIAYPHRASVFRWGIFCTIPGHLTLIPSVWYLETPSEFEF